MKLEEYNKKRNFSSTKEPEGKVQSSKDKLPIFVIQKHNASRLHYDFRIEVDGVLKSWAVPKGLSTDTKERHLAMMVEDHPYSYRDFEGIIPEGNYGAGEVIVWDTGTYTTEGATSRKDIEKKILEGIEGGDVKLILNGKKAKGRYAFVRFKRAGDNAWLLLKEKDDYVGSKLIDDNKSVLSGNTLEDIKKKKDNQTWNSEVIKPMLSVLVDKPFNDEQWIFEDKLDGYRAIADVNNSSVRLYSRNNITLNNSYPPIVNALSKLNFNAVFDGEIVVENEKGNSDFQLLQNYKNTGTGNLIYYIFDVLSVNGINIQELPLIERKKTLEKLIHDAKYLKKTNFTKEKGIEAFKNAQENKLEGIIAKKIDSPYIQDRTNNWQKIKALHRQEVVIGGYTFPEGQREAFGSLLLGVYEKGKLIYVGNTGSGFNSESLYELKEILDKNKIKNSPFNSQVSSKNVAQWVSPRFVAEVKFAGWTENNLMRQAIYLGLRKDKSAKEVNRE